MGIPKRPKRVRVFASIIFGAKESLESSLSDLEQVFGKIEERTEEMPFSHTRYYEREMGGDLKRVFLLFFDLKEREGLFKIKLETNEIERKYAHSGRRSVNIDPGYITLENVILFTTKNYTHRIYLAEGIYADLTLIFQKGTYNALPWTYPDYASREIILLFNRWREIYKRDLRSERC